MFSNEEKAFLEQVADGTLPVSLFTHTAHIRLAWLLLCEHPPEEAFARAAAAIQALVRKNNINGKFHMTITGAAVEIVWSFQKKSQTVSFDQFLEENPKLLTHFKDLLFEHYSEKLLNSEKATRCFLEPDLKDF
ncbi:MAG: hypothetical protein MI743_08510 [Sneathiellales bacterium]|nr:hypothetical protein [Sneathiellales bacterium]